MQKNICFDQTFIKGILLPFVDLYCRIFTISPKHDYIAAFIESFVHIFLFYLPESVIHFSQTSYKFDENAGTVEVDIIRSGSDLSHTSTVWCATRLTNPPSAESGQDYVPSSSQITFGPGQKIQVYTTFMMIFIYSVEN